MSQRKNVAIIATPAIPFGQAIIEGVTRYNLQHAHWKFHTTGGLPYLPAELLGRWRGDGIIGFITPELARRLTRRRTHYVNVATFGEQQPNPSVIVDGRAVGVMAAEHLLERSLRTYVLVLPAEGDRQIYRMRGFMDRIAQAGKTCELVRLPSRSFRGGLYGIKTDGLRGKLKQWPKPVGVFGLYDPIAREVLDCCQEMDLRVPEDVAIVGEGNWRFICEMLRPPLSSIDSGAERIGYKAAELLDRLMAGEEAPTEPILVPPRRLVARRSTDTLAMEDSNLVEALRFIRDNDHAAIQVSDVLGNVPVSRRTLEREFRNVLGRTIHQEIRRCRIARACRLLTETDMSIGSISDACGYSSQERFNVAFRSEQHTTPTTYRRQHSDPMTVSG